MPQRRSTSASCSAAWSSRASESRPPRRWRASATTSTSTAISSSRRTRGRESRSSTACRFPPTNPAWEWMKRYLVLAEGYSADPHYGKTARGVMRYGADSVVAVVDSERPGEALDGVPVVATVADALAYEPTTALVGVAPAGGRLPDKWRAILRSSLEAGLDLESGMHQFLGDDPELAALAGEHGGEIRELRRAPAGLSVPTGENLRHGATVLLTVGSDCAIGKMSVSLELDRGARERGLRSRFLPPGPRRL